MRNCLKFDITKIKNGVEWAISFPVVFAFAGFLNSSVRFFKHSQALVDPNNVRQVLAYHANTSLIHTMRGDWEEVHPYNDDLVKNALQDGDFFMVVNYIGSFAIVKTEQGEFSTSLTMIARLSEIVEVYEDARFPQYSIQIELLTQTRRLTEAQGVAGEGVLYAGRTGFDQWHIRFLGDGILALILSGDIQGAVAAIRDAKTMIAKQPFLLAVYAVTFLIGQFLVDLVFLKQAKAGRNRPDQAKYRIRAYQSGRAALKNSRKHAPYRTWIFALMGEYYWLAGKQRKALQWFDRSIREGERLGARPDLSRTYMAVGKCLMEPTSRFRELNGLGAAEYLARAETLFRDMDLQWDLEQLERVVRSA